MGQESAGGPEKDRRKRLSAALRENLRRRKQQARVRSVPSAAPGVTGEEPEKAADAAENVESMPENDPAAR